MADASAALLRPFWLFPVPFASTLGCISPRSWLLTLFSPWQERRRWEEQYSRGISLPLSQPVPSRQAWAQHPMSLAPCTIASPGLPAVCCCQSSLFPHSLLLASRLPPPSTYQSLEWKSFCRKYFEWFLLSWLDPDHTAAIIPQGKEGRMRLTMGSNECTSLQVVSFLPF